MAHKIALEFSKTYASHTTAETAVLRVKERFTEDEWNSFRYLILPVDDRFGVVFIGRAAAEAHMHRYFNVLA